MHPNISAWPSPPATASSFLSPQLQLQSAYWSLLTIFTLSQKGPSPWGDPWVFASPAIVLQCSAQVHEALPSSYSTCTHVHTWSRPPPLCDTKLSFAVCDYLCLPYFQGVAFLMAESTWVTSTQHLAQCQITLEIQQTSCSRIKENGLVQAQFLLLSGLHTPCSPEKNIKNSDKLCWWLLGSIHKQRTKERAG